jgi:hypothetical protein
MTKPCLRQIVLCQNAFSQKYTQTRHIVIFAKTNETLSMKYICPSTTINTQHILFKFYCLTGLLRSVDLSSISIYNEAKYGKLYYAKMHFINHIMQLLAAVSIKI